MTEQQKEQLDFGEQPIQQIITEQNLSAHDLVAASTEQLTHKMVSKACKGRKLTHNVKFKVLNALRNATDKSYEMKELFNY